MISIHVDVDNLWIYEKELKIVKHHSQDYLYDLIYDQALPSLIDVFEKNCIPATFFIVGKDTARRSCKQFIELAVKKNHEIANHTYSHRYDFHKLSAKEKEFEIKECSRVIEEITGNKVIGFRSPGYYLDDEIIDILIEMEIVYDSSVFPSPFTQIMGLYMKIFGDPKLKKAFGKMRYAFVNREISKINSRKRKDCFLYEIPITTSMLWRLPIHSTFILWLGIKYLNSTFFFDRTFKSNTTYLFHGLDLLQINNHPITYKQISLKRSLNERKLIVDKIIKRLLEFKIVSTKDQIAIAEQKGIKDSFLLNTTM